MLSLHVVPSGTNIFLTLIFYQHVVPSGTEGQIFIVTINLAPTPYTLHPNIPPKIADP
ncbi:MAG: hypothetical protein LBP59_04585 [Planctomycetaceae bacterium]|nr:hypothetical protein [Planctomycetaceae bacterium]